MLRFIFLLLATCWFSSAEAQFTWEQANKDQHGLSFEFDSTGRVFAVNGSLYRSVTEGSTWIKFIDLNDVTSFAVDSNGHYFLGTATKLLITTNEGDSWQPIHTKPVLAVEISPQNQLFVSSDSGLLRSTNNGQSWDKLLDSVTVDLISFSKEGVVFIRTPHHVLRSTDNGDSWKEIFTTPFTITSIKPIQSGKVYMTVARDVGGSVLGSETNGDSWFDVIGLGTTQVTDLALSNSNELFIAGGVQSDNDPKIYTAPAMYYSANGSEWSVVTEGLPLTAVRTMVILPSGRIIVSTDSGIYRSKFSASVRTKEIADLSNCTIFPNPSTGTSHIAFSLEKSGTTVIEVLDIVGRVVAQRSLGVLGSGSHEVSFNMMEFPVGTYTVMIRSNNAVRTTLLHIIR